MVRDYGELVYADKFVFVYSYDGHLYVLQPNEATKNEVTELLGPPETTDYERGKFTEPFHAVYGKPHLVGTAEEAFNDSMEKMKDPAKYEVDFNPAEVLHLMHEMAYSLREVYSSMKDMQFQQPVLSSAGRSAQLMEAHDLLERYRDEYLDGSWDDHDKQDQLYR